MISSFKGEFSFLSNMYPVVLEVRGMTFTCSEAVYMAAKCANPEDRLQFQGVDGYVAKRLGRKVTLRADWNDARLDVMRKVLKLKFAPGTALAEKLKATGEEVLEEGNTWNDRFWGVCNGQGQNHLGKLLMERRSELIREPTSHS